MTEARFNARDEPAQAAYNAKPCPYCGLPDHTGREHFQFVMSLSDEEQS